MLISPAEMLRDAFAGQYAVAAFNFYNLDTLMAILMAAEEERSPIIAQIYSTHFLHYNGGGMIAKAALEAIEDSRVPVALHLDHASDPDCIRAAMACGFNSVMYDGSALPLEQNIANTAAVVREARGRGIYTEAELGCIGRIGTAQESCDEYADAAEAGELVRRTGVDSLAPAIGTAHGIYRSTPTLNFKRLQEIRRAVGVPLVLHGGSGIPEPMIQKAIALGVSKINVGTELKYRWNDTIRDTLNHDQKDPIALSATARDAVKEVARYKIRLFGSSGRA